MAGERMTFRQMPNQKSQEEKNEENKINKETKKDFKEMMKANKEVVEEIVKAAEANAKRTEEQIERLGTTIAKAVGTDIKTSIEYLAAAIEGMNTSRNRSRSRTPARRKTTDQHQMSPPSTKKQDVTEKSREQNMEEETDEERMPLLMEALRNQEPKERTKDAEDKEEDGTNRQTQEGTLPNAQSRFRTTQMKDSQQREQPTKLPSIQEEVREIMKEQGRKIKELERRIKEIEEKERNKDRNNENKEKDKNREEERVNQEEPTENRKEKIYTPSTDIDAEGNPLINQEEHNQEPTPWDWVGVKIPRRRWEKKPILSETMDEKVSEEYERHIQDKYRGENTQKTRPQKEMTKEQRSETIKNMLSKAGLCVGIAPITKEHMERVEKLLLNKKVYKESEPKKSRIQRTVKSLVKSWAQKNLKITEEEWEEIEINEIIMTNNSDIVFISCANQEGASMLTSRARNLPPESGSKSPRIVMYVD